MYFDCQLWRMTTGLRWRVFVATLFGLLALAAGIARFVFLGLLLAAVFRGEPLAQLAWLLGGVAAAIFARAALEQTRHDIANRTAARVQETLRGRLFDKIGELGPGWFAGERTGGVMLLIGDGVEQLQTFFGAYLPQLFISASAPIIIFAFIMWWDLPVACVMLVMALVTLALPLILHRRERRSAITRKDAFKAYGEELLDAIQGLPTLMAFGQSRAYRDLLAQKAKTLSETTMGVVTASLMSRGITDFGIGVGAAAGLALGAYRATHGMMSLEALLVILMAGTEIFRPLRDLRNVLHQGMMGQSAAVGVLGLLATRATAPAGGSSAPDLQPAIRLEQVRFTYPGGRDAALNDLTFSVAPGERVGIVGVSGAGKSSIVRLLLRLYDADAGTVSIGGRDSRSIDPDSIRRQIAVVAQDTYLFYGTVEDNLRLGKPDATRSEIEAAARAANVHDFVLSLPYGYQTLIGERGTRLSGGQRQRIAIARALLRDSPILVLDEALSSVDAENEAVIQEALDRLTQGRTTLILAHRLSSVIASDRILVLDAGRVVESGSHAELMRADGQYRRLMGAQAAIHAAAARVEADAASDRALWEGTEEEALEKKVKPRDLNADAQRVGWRETLSLLTRVLRPWRGQLAVTATSGVGRVAALIAVGALSALAVAAVKAGDFPAILITVLLVVAPLAGFLHVIESLLAHDMGYALLAEMRVELYRKLEALAPAYLLERRSGDLVSLAAQDVETLEYFFAHTMAPTFVAVFVPCVVLGVLAYSAWPLALVLLPFLAYAAASPLTSRRRIDDLGSQARAALGQLGAHVTETIQGLAELIAFQALPGRRADFMALVRRYQQTRIALLDDLARQSERLDLATGLGGVAIAACGAYLAARGAIDPTVLPLLILISAAAFVPISELAQVGRQLADTIASTRRLCVVHSEPVRIVDGAGPAAAPTPAAILQFDHVAFTYPGRLGRALSDVSFEVTPGTTTALVGRSGAGKSTVANLLLRFWDPDVGSIRLGDSDLRDLPLDRLRERIALVAQDTYLFNNTLEANIRLARPDASRIDVETAIERAALSEFVRSLPDGLETRVGERGVQLSGGQRQRIAIARAFLKDAPILVLDEATSHLDTLSEAHVRAALHALMANRTTIVIAHRLSTVRAAHQIVVLDSGRVVEHGTHAELLKKRGYYARLVEHQVSSVQLRSVDAAAG
jgi:ATP-binding cassette subfamily C protein CydCD